ncbi:MAG: hypothetical protein HW385_1131 [candidate division NC10 bacterium]|nr:hypothetical protein [candidate division NC10 bacterium]
MKSILCIVAASLIAALPAAAQPWPAKTVRIMVPNAPGSGPDLLARLASDRLARLLAMSFVVENNTAGAGIVAARNAAKSAPDGYTLLIGTVTSLAINPFVFAELPYRPERDFAGAAMVYDTSSQVVAVHPEVPAGNLAELIALAKSQPGKLAYAADRGLASIVGEWMFRTAGAPITLIPYKSPAQSLTDTSAGRTQAIIISLAAIDSLRKAGKLRVLAVISVKRFPGLPELPAVAETLPGFNGNGWSTLVAPTGTPVEILRRINQATDQVVREREYTQRLLALGYTIDGAGTLESIAEFHRSEREKWGRVIRELGIKPE